MSKSNNLSDFMLDLANTIRAKKGYSSSVMINPQKFSDEVSTITTEQPQLNAPETPSWRYNCVAIFEDPTANGNFVSSHKVYSGTTLLGETTRPSVNLTTMTSSSGTLKVASCGEYFKDSETTSFSYTPPKLTAMSVSVSGTTLSWSSATYTHESVRGYAESYKVYVDGKLATTITGKTTSSNTLTFDSTVDVTVNGSTVTSPYTLKNGDVIEISAVSGGILLNDAPATYDISYLTSMNLSLTAGSSGGVNKTTIYFGSSYSFSCNLASYSAWNNLSGGTYTAEVQALKPGFTSAETSVSVTKTRSVPVSYVLQASSSAKDLNATISIDDEQQYNIVTSASANVIAVKNVSTGSNITSNPFVTVIDPIDMRIVVSSGSISQVQIYDGNTWSTILSNVTGLHSIDLSNASAVRFRILY